MFAAMNMNKRAHCTAEGDTSDSRVDPILQYIPRKLRNFSSRNAICGVGKMKNVLTNLRNFMSSRAEQSG